jgi:hypothetical protein
VVRHGDVEGGAVEVLRAGRAADGAVVLGAAIGGADDQRLAEPVAQRLQLVERGFVDQQLASAAAGDLGRAEKFGQRQVPSGTSRQWS